MTDCKKVIRDPCDWAGSSGDPPLCKLQIVEPLDSRQTVRDIAKLNDTIEIVLFVRGTNDENAVRARIEHESFGLPGTYDNLPMSRYELRQVAWLLWEVRAYYGWYGAARLGYTPGYNIVMTLPTQITFSVTSSRTRISKSISNIDSWPKDGDEKIAPDLEGAINWDGTRVNGVDVLTPTSRYTETWIFDRTFLFSEYKSRRVIPDGQGGFERKRYANRLDLWSDFTGCVHGIKRANTGGNQADPDTKDNATQAARFRNWQGGEALLYGVNLSQVSLDYFEATFEFHIKKNSNVQLPKSVDTTEPWIIAEGWDYLWWYEALEDADAGEQADRYKVTVGKPKYAYLEWVADRVNFDDLGVGIRPFNPQLIRMITGLCRPENQIVDGMNKKCAEAMS